MSTKDDIARVTAKMRRNAHQLKFAVVLEAVGRIVRRTPVDTGRARGSWQVTVGSPASGVPDRLDLAGTAEPDKVGRMAGSILFGIPTYIVSNLDYMDKLEHGSSKQAPNGMVALTAAEIPAIVELASQRFGV